MWQLREKFGTRTIVATVVLLIGVGILGVLAYVGANSPEPVTPQVLIEYTATATFTPLPSPTVTSRPQLLPTESPKPTISPTVAPASAVGGIVYALSPRVNAVGWVRSGESGNHFGDSNLFSGWSADRRYLGAMQFDLSFLPPDALIYSAQLELTGLQDAGLGSEGTWTLSLLGEAMEDRWASHTYEVISNAPVSAVIPPVLMPTDLGRTRVNIFEFSAEQRALLESRLAVGSVSFRIDGPAGGEENLFAWDAGYGSGTLGHGPILRLGVLLPTPIPNVTQTAESEALAAGYTPTPTATYVVVTSTPTPENIFTVAALAATATQVATATGTYTPVPENWVTPIVVTPRPAPANTATAEYQDAVAMAEVIAFGTPTPTPMNVWTATPTAVFVLLNGELPAPAATPAPTATPEPIPPVLVGKIAFLSDRAGGDEPLVYVVDPDGSNLALLTDRIHYEVALARDAYSADQRYRVFVKDALINTAEDNGSGRSIPVQLKIPTLFFYDFYYKAEEQITHFGAGIAYDPAWSPTLDRIAFVSTDSGNDEIWVINRDGSDARQLTSDQYDWWDKHPSWSPDGSKIVFWSNRTGNRQIYVMNADGSGLYSLSHTGFNDWDPVWIKYTDPARDPAQVE
jgi:hypothetical protein